MTKLTISLPTNWKTDIAGLAALALAVYTGAMEPSWQVAVRDPVFWSMLVTGLLGLMAKDFNTTGGTNPQPSTMAALEGANQRPSVVNPPADAPVSRYPDTGQLIPPDEPVKPRT